MALSGKRVFQFEIKSSGNLFIELWKTKPHQIPSLTPTTVRKCEVLHGQVGTVDSVLLWNYILDGKDCVVKSVTKDINAREKSVTYEVLEGDVLEQYKTFVSRVQVDKHGLNNLVTWTLEYEKLSPNMPDPDIFMEFCKKMTKDIETHHLEN